MPLRVPLKSAMLFCTWYRLVSDKPSISSSYFFLLPKSAEPINRFLRGSFFIDHDDFCELFRIKIKIKNRKWVSLLLYSTRECCSILPCGDFLHYGELKAGARSGLLVCPDYSWCACSPSRSGIVHAASQ